jgi:hypothetical protein
LDAGEEFGAMDLGEQLSGADYMRLKKQKQVHGRPTLLYYYFPHFFFKRTLLVRLFRALRLRCSKESLST